MVRFEAGGDPMICVCARPCKRSGWSALAGMPTMVRLAFEGAPAASAGSRAGAGARGFGARSCRETPTMVRAAGLGAWIAAARRVPQKGHATEPSGGVAFPHCGQCDMARM